MKHLFIYIFLALSLSSFGQVKKYLRQADRKTDLNDKIELYNQALAIEPENLDALFYRALVKTELGDLFGAIVDYSKIILIKPDADSYFNRGNARYGLQQFEGAKADYEKAVELDPSFVDAWFSLACVKFDLQNYEGAIKDFNNVVRLQPAFPKVYTLRAAAYNAIESYKKALKDYTIAILASGSPDAYYDRGIYFLNINYYKQAYEDFDKCLRINNDNPYAYFHRGATTLLLGRFDEAISDFMKALSYDAKDFDALLGLAITYYSKEDVTNAKLYFEKAKNILNINTSEREAYESTYWYQNKYYYFVNKLRELQDI